MLERIRKQLRIDHSGPCRKIKESEEKTPKISATFNVQIPKVPIDSVRRSVRVVCQQSLSIEETYSLSQTHPNEKVEEVEKSELQEG